MKEKISLTTILQADKKQLVKMCRTLRISTHGNEEQLKERLIRHIFPVEKEEEEPKFIGKLNINTARPEQFLLWPRIGKVTVDNIMQYRQKYGRFHSVEEMLNVKGIGIKTFGLLRPFLTIKGPTTLKIKRGEEEIEEYIKIKEIEETIRKKEHELRDWEEAIESDHEELEEMEMEIQKEQEALIEKEMLIAEKEKEIEELKNKLEEKEKKIKGQMEEIEKKEKTIKEMEEKVKEQEREIQQQREEIEKRAEVLKKKEKEILQLKEKVEKTYGKIEKGDLIPREKVQQMLEGFKRDEEELKDAYTKLLSNYNKTKEELLELIEENEALRRALDDVMEKQEEISRTQTKLMKTYEENIVEQKELEAKRRELEKTEKKLKEREEALKKKSEEIGERLKRLKEEKRGLEKEKKKIEKEEKELARQRREIESLFDVYNKKIALTGTLNINKASREEMRLWPHLNDKVIENIINYREKYGGFKRLEEFKEVAGVGEETYKVLLPFLRLKGETGLKIVVGAEVSKAVEEILEYQKVLEEEKKRLYFERDRLESEFAERKEHLERELKEVERELKKRYEIKENELVTRIRQKEEELVNEFVERRKALEEKYKSLLAEVKKEEAKLKEFEKEYRKKKKELEIKEEIYRKNLVVEARLNINRASKEELCLWPGITKAVADEIVAYREKYRGFKKPEELMNVKGVGMETYKILAPFITLKGPTGIELKRADEIRNIVEALEKEKKEVENLRKSLVDRRDALNELYEEKEQETLRLKELQREYKERRKAIDEIYEERLRLKEEAEIEKMEYIKKKEELDEIYKQKLEELEEKYKEKEEELRIEIEEKKKELEEEFEERKRELEAEFQEKENYYQYRMRELEKREERVAEREEIQERNAILFGRINLNKATKEELCLWPHITETIAEEIIAYRKKYRGFKDVDQLKEVKGIGEETFQLLRPFVDVKGPTGLKINEGFDAETILDDLEKRRQEYIEAKHTYHVRKRELEWEFQERFGAKEKELKEREKALEKEKERFKEEMTNLRNEFEREVEAERCQLREWEEKLNEREVTLKEMKRELKRLEGKLKRRANYLDKLDVRLSERERALEKNATLFGKLNINRASKEELCLWPHITETIAEEIIAYRERRRFRRIEEIKEIKGVGEETYLLLRPFLTVSGETGLKINAGEEVYTILDDLEDRRKEMLEAKAEYHRLMREIKKEYHEKVEKGLRDIEKAKMEFDFERRKFEDEVKAYRQEIRMKEKELEEREKKVREEEEILELNAVLYGKINLNTASVQELMYWPRISPKIAKNIVAYRKKYGGFKKVEEFKEVAGVGEETYKILRPFLTLSGKTGLKINVGDRKTKELREIEERIRKTAEHYQKKAELLEENLEEIARFRESVEKDRYELENKAEEIEKLREEIFKKYEELTDLKNKMEEMHDTMGKILTGGKLEGISVRSLLPKEELEAFEREKEELQKKAEELNEMLKKVEEEREQLGFASKFRVKIPLEIEVGDEPIEDDIIIIKDEESGFVKEVLLATHGKRINDTTYSVVLPEIPAGRKYTIIRDTGKGKRYIIAKNYPAKVVIE